MKQFICCLAALCLLLAGCAQSAPEQAADGAAWDESWTTLGGVLGVEAPGHDLTLQDNKDALSIAGMYLASWTIGEGAPYTNEDGDEVVLYPAQLDVLVYGRKDLAVRTETPPVRRWRTGPPVSQRPTMSPIPASRPVTDRTTPSSPTPASPIPTPTPGVSPLLVPTRIAPSA